MEEIFGLGELLSVPASYLVKTVNRSLAQLSKLRTPAKRSIKNLSESSQLYGQDRAVSYTVRMPSSNPNHLHVRLRIGTNMTYTVGVSSKLHISPGLALFDTQNILYTRPSPFSPLLPISFLSTL